MSSEARLNPGHRNINIYGLMRCSPFNKISNEEKEKDLIFNTRQVTFLRSTKALNQKKLCRTEKRKWQELKRKPHKNLLSSVVLDSWTRSYFSLDLIKTRNVFMCAQIWIRRRQRRGKCLYSHWWNSSDYTNLSAGAGEGLQDWREADQARPHIHTLRSIAVTS